MSIHSKLELNVSKSQKQIVMLLILLKNEQYPLRILSWVCFIRFFGRIRDFIICFRDLLTFRRKWDRSIVHFSQICGYIFLLTYMFFTNCEPEFYIQLCKSNQNMNLWSDFGLNGSVSNSFSCTTWTQILELLFKNRQQSFFHIT